MYLYYINMLTFIKGLGETDMIIEVLISEAFKQALDHHPHPNVVGRKVRLLAEDPTHPSLKTHRLHQVKDKNIWDCSVTDSERLLYELKDGALYLWDLGSHAVVDKVHLRSFAAHTRFSRLELAPA